MTKPWQLISLVLIALSLLEPHRSRANSRRSRGLSTSKARVTACEARLPVCQVAFGESNQQTGAFAMTNEVISPLRRRMIEDMTVRNLSPTTRASYIHNVKKFSQYFGRSPDRLGLEDVRAYQVHLVSEGVAWATLNQIVSSLRFFYGVTLGRKDLPERIPYARRLKTVPVILSREEVAAFLEAVPIRRDRVALTTAYATGVRSSEVVWLRVQDIDSSRMTIHVACAVAVEAAGLKKCATVHALRHAFATHLVEQGTHISIVQALLGHGHLSTTARYINLATSTIAATQSPLELLPLNVPEMR